MQTILCWACIVSNILLLCPPLLQTRSRVLASAFYFVSSITRSNHTHGKLPPRRLTPLDLTFGSLLLNKVSFGLACWGWIRHALAFGSFAGGPHFKFLERARSPANRHTVPPIFTAALHYSVLCIEECRVRPNRNLLRMLVAHPGRNNVERVTHAITPPKRYQQSRPIMTRKKKVPMQKDLPQEHGS
jgi:hypothetical protein